MAAIAEPTGFFFPDGPCMSLVAIETDKRCLCHVQIMLAHTCLAPMTGLQTVLTRRLDFAVGMMAVETFQG